MTQEEVKIKMREGMRRLDPIAASMNSLILDAYEEGFRSCWELLTGQELLKRK